MDRFLVTGGAGFIGSNISAKLISQRCFVRVIDNLLTGKKSNLSAISEKIEFIEADMGDEKIARSAMKDIDVVLHQGALPSVPRSVDDPAATHAHCLDATFTLLLAARDASVMRVVLASSSSVYGGAGPLPKMESMPSVPRSPYAVSKVACENYASVFPALYGTETVSLRYFNIFGPRQDPTGFYSAVIPRFISLLLRNESPVIYGDGKQSRDFTDVANAVQANLLAVSEPRANGEVFNVGTGVPISFLDLAKTIVKVAGTGKVTFTEFTQERKEVEPGDYYTDISKIKRIVGWVPRTSLEEGVKKTIEFYRKHKEEYW